MYYDPFGSNGLVVCPQCGKAVSRLYEYDKKWVCVDCLNKALAENGEPAITPDGLFCKKSHNIKQTNSQTIQTLGCGGNIIRNIEKGVYVI